MRTASAFATERAVPASRPRLTAVSTPAPPRPASRGNRLAALLAGLCSGFVLAAAAAALGGGSPGGSLSVAAVCGVMLVGVLVHARAATVRARRRRAAARRVSVPRRAAVGEDRRLRAA